MTAHSRISYLTGRVDQTWCHQVLSGGAHGGRLEPCARLRLDCRHFQYPPLTAPFVLDGHGCISANLSGRWLLPPRRSLTIGWSRATPHQFVSASMQPKRLPATATAIFWPTTRKVRTSGPTIKRGH